MGTQSNGKLRFLNQSWSFCLLSVPKLELGNEDNPASADALTPALSRGARESWAKAGERGLRLQDT
ncbi:hypothetical protein GMPD_01670 [Geomonas paludis]|uniref:Uncharacterized protein n=1 Tax=Geomonas paludis TaxID=2740185 RepID=A0A6V8MQB5_9BACT|nr:hypothetical protein GMPD_01670 [Geomonas paludis]